MSKSILENKALTNFDSIFKSTTKKTDGESIADIPLEELYPPEFHPFQVNDDETMERLVKSVKQYGVREPGLARLRRDEDGKLIGGYELLCGNRRKRACELAELPMLPIVSATTVQEIRAYLGSFCENGAVQGLVLHSYRPLV